MARGVSISLSSEAEQYLDYLAEQMKTVFGKPNRSQLINKIVLGQIDLSKYPMPENVRREIMDKGQGK
jgi:hypothetical protein